MKRVDDNKSGSMLDYDGDHVFQHLLLEPDHSRTRWHLEDVPTFIRIDHPFRRPFRSQGGAAGTREIKAPEVARRPPPVRIDPPRKQAPRRKPAAEAGKVRKVSVWHADYGVRNFEALVFAKVTCRFSFSAKHQDHWCDWGWCEIESKGVVVWLQSHPVPAIVAEAQRIRAVSR